MEKQKKKMIIFTVLLSVVAIALIGAFAFMELRENNVIGSLESKEIMNEFNKVYNKKEKTVIFYSSSTCGYCELQKPIFETIVEDYNIKTYSIDSNELSSSQRKEVLNKLGIEHATPTIVIVENGKVVASKVGYTEGSALVDFFKENKVVSKDAVYSKEANITFINYDEYKALVRKDDTSVIVIGQDGCSHCSNYKPALNSVAEDYNIAMNYLNLTNLTTEESNKLFENLKNIGYDDPDFLKDGSFGTPLTLIIEDGEVEHYISGERTISQLVRELTRAGVIEE